VGVRKGKNYIGRGGDRRGGDRKRRRLERRRAYTSIDRTMRLPYCCSCLHC
jgi:hypothetical protein